MAGGGGADKAIRCRATGSSDGAGHEAALHCDAVARLRVGAAGGGVKDNNL